MALTDVPGLDLSFELFYSLQAAENGQVVTVAGAAHVARHGWGCGRSPYVIQSRPLPGCVAGVGQGQIEVFHLVDERPAAWFRNVDVEVAHENHWRVKRIA
jgi:hypothetical protein